mmetsp:Transcript_113310/g.360201  ORF Transcript_113310/g.360201 Transcript_113310/m.360201 type:complete len:295 (+) Transcript_113310:188-1072(+)
MRSAAWILQELQVEGYHPTVHDLRLLALVVDRVGEVRLEEGAEPEGMAGHDDVGLQRCRATRREYPIAEGLQAVGTVRPEALVPLVEGRLQALRWNGSISTTNNSCTDHRPCLRQTRCATWCRQRQGIDVPADFLKTGEHPDRPPPAEEARKAEDRGGGRTSQGRAREHRAHAQPAQLLPLLALEKLLDQSRLCDAFGAEGRVDEEGVDAQKQHGLLPQIGDQACRKREVQPAVEALIPGTLAMPDENDALLRRGSGRGFTGIWRQLEVRVSREHNIGSAVSAEHRLPLRRSQV